MPSVALTVLRIVCCRVAGPAKCAAMMKMGDTDGDGLLSLEEFLQLGAIHESMSRESLSRPEEPAGYPTWFPDRHVLYHGKPKTAVWKPPRVTALLQVPRLGVHTLRPLRLAWPCRTVRVSATP